MASISDELATFGVRHERDESTSHDYRHKVWDCCGIYLGRMDAHEAVRLLNNLRYGMDEPGE